MSDLSDALLEAHVQHELARLRDGVPTQVDATVRALFEWFGTITLGELTTEEAVLGIIDRCVIDLPVSGGIVELTGEAARLVFSSLASNETRISDVVADGDYDGFADKIVKLERAWREVASIIARSEAFGVIVVRLVARALPELLVGPSEGGRLARMTLPAVERQLRKVLSAQLARERARARGRQQRSLLEALDPEYVRALVDEVWATASSLRLSEVFQLLQEDDLEDFVVLCHEFWLHYRRTPYFRRIAGEVVAHVFAKYRRHTVASVIDDMGVTEQVVARELEVVLAPLIQKAAASDVVQAHVRARLAPFYRSDAFANAVARTGGA
jgi:hypothetical protein